MNLLNDEKLTIARIAPLIRKKQISPVELTDFFLERIHRLQPKLNAFITVTAGLAPVRLGAKWGYIDGKGRQAAPFKYDKAGLLTGPRGITRRLECGFASPGSD